MIRFSGKSAEPTVIVSELDFLPDVGSLLPHAARDRPSAAETAIAAVNLWMDILLLGGGVMRTFVRMRDGSRARGVAGRRRCRRGSAPARRPRLSRPPS